MLQHIHNIFTKKHRDCSNKLTLLLSKNSQIYVPFYSKNQEALPTPSYTKKQKYHSIQLGGGKPAIPWIDPIHSTIGKIRGGQESNRTIRFHSKRVYLKPMKKEALELPRKKGQVPLCFHLRERNGK